jgi:hypothetical protein
MMANVKLSAAELELVTNAQFILTKNAIITKVYELFGQLAESYTDQINGSNIFTESILKIPPKISKGENQEGLPWVMLDYPRLFKAEETLAIRSFFWWGNFCSITLQLKGNYAERFKLELKANSSRLTANENWFLCCNEDEWLHHFREDNYRPLSSFTQEEIKDLPFIKLAKKIPLQEWDNLYQFYTASFSELLNMLSLTA